ncbi:MAG: 4-alpha-glucanotransferase [Clostridia bacterium]|nr:4-alpha-glucanotransferase [Clostridia bacterium]
MEEVWRVHKLQRSAGVLLPVSALPSRYGIGCFSKEAYAFVDFLAAAGQRYWQILPLCPTGYGDSPYQSVSSFAGNPYFIDLDALVAQGWLTAAECSRAFSSASETQIDYALQYRARLPLLRRAYVRFGKRATAAQRSAYTAFLQRESHWIDDYAHFMALKDAHNGAPLPHWERALQSREGRAMKKSKEALADDIAFYGFVQYVFFEQWTALRHYANARGVAIIGDLPIYVAADSADVWAHPQLFQLDDAYRPTAVAGCPPDGFSAKGQRWGNPLYFWPAHEEEGFRWWLSRLRHCFAMYDVVRIDHFRGFASYYSIPADAADATVGHWERGVGKALFARMAAVMGECPIIAEDLGYMTEEVRELLRYCGFPGMKVLQFAFDGRDEGSKNDHLPHLYPEHCVAYTGTHDNQTLRGWLGTISDAERYAVRSYLCDFNTPTPQLTRPLVALLLRSAARLCIVPLQDYLNYDDAARINTPSTEQGNWMWRVGKDVLSAALAADIRRMTGAYGR